MLIIEGIFSVLIRIQMVFIIAFLIGFYRKKGTLHDGKVFGTMAAGFLLIVSAIGEGFDPIYMVILIGIAATLFLTSKLLSMVLGNSKKNKEDDSTDGYDNNSSNDNNSQYNNSYSNNNNNNNSSSSTRTLDPYEILGVSRNDSNSTIKHKYWKLAKKYQPDISDDPEADKKAVELIMPMKKFPKKEALNS